MILNHHLHTAPVRSSEAVPTQHRIEQERRDRLERMRRAATLPPTMKAITLRKPKLLPSFHPKRLAEHLVETLAEPVHVAPEAETPFLPGEEPAPPATSAEIIKQVCAKHGVRPAEIVSPIRAHFIVPARHEAMYRIREERHLSWAQLARLFNRDHTSVIHGWRKHKASLEAAG